MRVASAPVSFGIFELTAEDDGLPDPVAVLDAMVDAGYVGTELGPPGYFGDPAGTAAALRERGVSLVGSFLPMRLSRREHMDEDFAFLDEALSILEETSPNGDERPVVLVSDSFSEPDRLAGAGRIEELPATWLGEARFDLLVANAHRAAELCHARGYAAAFHYHGGTYVETPREIDRFAERMDTSLIGLCFDSGHSSFGGGDPLAFLDTYGELVSHVHLKDVDGAVMEQIRTSGLGLREAWRRGVFCRFGEGSVDMPAVLERLRGSGYDSWLVVEQDRLIQPGQTVEMLADDQAHNRALLRELGV
ncbi:MAG: sugar phosphate isomerase/epimerase family protein [Gaiellales bacterium]|jgi:inosose dehydratase